jgi:hypothetical protein
MTRENQLAGNVKDPGYASMIAENPDVNNAKGLKFVYMIRLRDVARLAKEVKYASMVAEKNTARIAWGLKFVHMVA